MKLITSPKHDIKSPLNEVSKGGDQGSIGNQVGDQLDGRSVKSFQEMLHLFQLIDK